MNPGENKQNLNLKTSFNHKYALLNWMKKSKSSKQGIIPIWFLLQVLSKSIGGTKLTQNWLHTRPEQLLSNLIRKRWKYKRFSENRISKFCSKHRSQKYEWPNSLWHKYAPVWRYLIVTGIHSSFCYNIRLCAFNCIIFLQYKTS